MNRRALVVSALAAALLPGGIASASPPGLSQVLRTNPGALGRGVPPSEYGRLPNTNLVPLWLQPGQAPVTLPPPQVPPVQVLPATGPPVILPSGPPLIIPPVTPPATTTTTTSPPTTTPAQPATVTLDPTCNAALTATANAAVTCAYSVDISAPLALATSSLSPLGVLSLTATATYAAAGSGPTPVQESFRCHAPVTSTGLTQAPSCQASVPWAFNYTSPQAPPPVVTFETTTAFTPTSGSGLPASSEAGTWSLATSCAIATAGMDPYLDAGGTCSSTAPGSWTGVLTATATSSPLLDGNEYWTFDLQTATTQGAPPPPDFQVIGLTPATGSLSVQAPAGATGCEVNIDASGAILDAGGCTVTGSLTNLSSGDVLQVTATGTGGTWTPVKQPPNLTL